MTKPSAHLEQEWYRSVDSHRVSRNKIHTIIAHINNFNDLFKPDPPWLRLPTFKPFLPSFPVSIIFVPTSIISYSSSSFSHIIPSGLATKLPKN
ncbi:hypothetical protein AVEN_20580-1 [Araneus ventricosus]|uniref:Uncharacterized protein n=1 Tax=Araneus ventricosus TaxID=182803 RepID=A0A4Y2EI70_ARAVE|nr:hypothetical protein AVEN_20580-1 [Araneus ventricosus]